MSGPAPSAAVQQLPQSGAAPLRPHHCRCSVWVGGKDKGTRSQVYQRCSTNGSSRTRDACCPMIINTCGRADDSPSGSASHTITSSAHRHYQGRGGGRQDGVEGQSGVWEKSFQAQASETLPLPHHHHHHHLHALLHPESWTLKLLFIQTPPRHSSGPTTPPSSSDMLAINIAPAGS